MSNIIFRINTSPAVPGSDIAKGSPLTNAEIDGNFKSLQNSIRDFDASQLTSGTIPANRINDTSHGNRGGGTLHNAATTSVNGFMSSGDKTKLDGIATSANNYTHPTGGANSTITATTGLVLSSITVNSLGHVTAVGSKTLAAGDLPSHTHTLANISDSGNLAAISTNGSTTNFLRGDGSWINPPQGTVTSVAASSGTGISVTGSPITSSGTLTITNTAPHIATNLGITAGTIGGPIVTSSTGTNATLPIATASNSGVVTTGAQTFAGVKTFNSTITGSISGNAGTVTNGVYTTGNQSIAGNKTFTGTTNTSALIVSEVGSYFDVTGSSRVTGAIYAGTLNPNVDPVRRNWNANVYVNTLNAMDNITAYASDKRLKTNINNIESALEKVLTLNGVYYNWNEKANELAGYKTDEKHVGLIAQEVQEVLPEIIKLAPFDNVGDGTSQTGYNYLTIQYERLVPLLVEAIKELKAEIDELRGK